MSKHPINKNDKNLGWRWELVTNIDEWKIPDGQVMRLAFILEKEKEKKILDIGCGLGRHIVYFARQGFQVCGIDISEHAVSHTNKWLREEKLEADVHKGAFTSINYPNNTFNLVIALNVIYHGFKKEIIKGFSEVLRILKPGGIFYGTLKTKSKDEPFDNEGIEIINNQTIILREGIEANVPHYFSYKEDLIEFFQGYEVDKIIYCEYFYPPQLVKSFIKKAGSGYFHYFLKKPAN